MGQAQGVLTTVSSAANLVLKGDSARKHRITGTSTQAILLPSGADVELGTEFVVFNRSTGAVTVSDSANANPMTVATLTTQRFTLVDKTGVGIWIMG